MPSGRRWTLAREDAARRHAALGNASAIPARLERAFRRLDREIARESHLDLVARGAAGELLDHAAGHCFVDPVAATDVVRWNHLRRQGGQVRESLRAGPAAFGELRVEREAPEVWASLPEPRHGHVPAWARFREAAGAWLDVHDARPWTPPAEFPAPPAEPAPYPRTAGPAAPPLERRALAALPSLPDEPPLRGRERSRGLSR